MKDLKRLVMIVSIIERGNGNKLIKLYDQEQVFTHMRCEGTGTATSEIMDILGLGGSEKDIILSFAPAGTALNLLEKLKDDLHDLCPGRGIAFMVAMEAVTNLLAASIGARTKLEKDREYEDMQEELMDRFGEPPKAVENLLAIAALKALAHKVYITEIKQTGKDVKIIMFKRAKLDPAGFPGILEKYKNNLKMHLEEPPYFQVSLKGRKPKETLDVLVFLKSILTDFLPLAEE